MRPEMFPSPVGRCYPLNSSPYIIDFEQFVATYGDSTRRKELVSSLEILALEMSESGSLIRFGLFGGSFLDTRVKSPKDLDGLVFFDEKGARETRPGVHCVPGLRARAEALSLDLRFVPIDVGLMWIVKISCFASALYARDRGTDQSNHGSILVELTRLAGSEKG